MKQLIFGSLFTVSATQISTAGISAFICQIVCACLVHTHICIHIFSYTRTINLHMYVSQKRLEHPHKTRQMPTLPSSAGKGCNSWDVR